MYKFTRKCLHYVIVTMEVLTNILMALYMQQFARWQLCWCCL